MDWDLQRRVGDNLRAYRKGRGLSQEAFADVFGYHRTYMGAVERGERNLTLQTLERIATEIKVDPVLLLTETEKKPRARKPKGSKSSKATGSKRTSKPKRATGAGKRKRR